MQINAEEHRIKDTCDSTVKRKKMKEKRKNLTGKINSNILIEPLVTRKTKMIEGSQQW
jgi:hypothetical protein